MVFQCVSPHWAVLRAAWAVIYGLTRDLCLCTRFLIWPVPTCGGNVICCVCFTPSNPLPRWQGPSLGLSRLGRHLRKPLDWVVRFTSSLPATPGPLLVCHTKTFHVPPCACQITSRHHSMLSCQHMNHSEQRSACGLYFLSQRGDIPVMLPSCSSLLVLEVLGQTLRSSFWGEAPEHLSARSGSPHPGLSETWVSVPSRIGPLCCSMRFSNLALFVFPKQHFYSHISLLAALELPQF